MKPKEWDGLVDNYFEEILSPFADNVKNPIYLIIKKIKNKNKVIDLGTGKGLLIPFLAKNFNEVVAVDFSEKMIKYAKEKNKFKNTHFIVKDIVSLKEFYNYFNVVIAVNSIIMPSLIKVDKAFKEAYNILKNKGVFIGVFPAIESELSDAMLIFENEFKKTNNEIKAIKNTHKLIGNNYDFLLGILNCSGRQKHYYRFEIYARLRSAGFKDIEISRIVYPWENYDKNKSGKKTEIWDWLVIAKKDG